MIVSTIDAFWASLIESRLLTERQLADLRAGFAAVDVYETEPVVGAQHALLHMPNALCTPHLGYAERGSYEALYTLAVDQLLAFAAGAPINVANPEAIGKR